MARTGRPRRPHCEPLNNTVYNFLPRRFAGLQVCIRRRNDSTTYPINHLLRRNTTPVDGCTVIWNQLVPTDRRSQPRQPVGDPSPPSGRHFADSGGSTGAGYESNAGIRNISTESSLLIIVKSVVRDIACRTAQTGGEGAANGAATQPGTSGADYRRRGTC
jgi:hypothetical protein